MNALRRFWQKPRGWVVDVLPVVLYCSALFWGGLIPLKSLPGPEFAFADKVWHAGAFGGLTGLACRALKYWGRPSSAAMRASAILAVGLGALLEVMQAFTSYRSADVFDLVADAVGVVVAYAVLRVLERGPQVEGAH